MKLHTLAALAVTALLPALAPAQDAVPTTLSYLTFNIGGGAPENFGYKHPFDLPRAAQTIKKLDADFVALQEVDQFVGRNKNPKRDTAGDLAKAAGYPYHHFAKTITVRDGDYGIALLSKYKPLSVKSFVLPKTNEQRVLLDARFRMADGKTLAVLATHLDFPSSARQKQATAIVQYLKDNPADRVLFAGDLNANLDSPELKILATALTPLTPTISETFTTPHTVSHTVPHTAPSRPRPPRSLPFTSHQQPPSTAAKPQRSAQRVVKGRAQCVCVCVHDVAHQHEHLQCLALNRHEFGRRFVGR